MLSVNLLGFNKSLNYVITRRKQKVVEKLVKAKNNRLNNFKWKWNCSGFVLFSWKRVVKDQKNAIFRQKISEEPTVIFLRL
jgi:hypothetical protein